MKIRECAQGILNLGIANSLLTTKSPTIELNSCNGLFTSKEADVQQIIKDCHNNIAINEETINNIIKLASNGGNVKTKKNELTKMLLLLRNHEVSITVSKFINIYETKKLQQILLSCVGIIKSFQEATDLTLGKLGNGCKGHILSKLETILTKMKDLKQLKDREAKKAERIKIRGMLSDLIEFVGESFEISQIKAAKMEIEEKIGDLTKHKLIFDNIINASQKT